MQTKGKVTEDSGRYFLQIGDKRHELTPEMAGGIEALHALAGQEVEVLYSEPVPVALLHGRGRITCYLVMPPELLSSHPRTPEPAATARLGKDIVHLRPTCYVPAPWVIKGVEEQVRANLARELLDQRVISQEVYDKLVGR